jgi:hypothetical protein
MALTAATMSGLRANSRKRRNSRASFDMNREPFIHPKTNSRIPHPQDRIVDEMLGVLMLDGCLYKL